MKLTDKAKEDFDNWFLKREEKDPSWLYKNLTDSMKWGVYLDFFIEKGFYIETIFYWGGDWFKYEISLKLDYKKTYLKFEKEGFNSLFICRLSAIEKANEIYNE